MSLIDKKYCAECGEELNVVKIPAGGLRDDGLGELFIPSYGVYDNFDTQTGERQWAYQYVCPLKKKDRDDHTDYIRHEDTNTYKVYWTI